MKWNPWHLFFILLFVFPLTIEEFGGKYRGLASSWTIIPSRSLAGLHYIFKGYKLDDEQSVFKVTGPLIEITSGEHMVFTVFREGYSSEMDEEDFEEEQTLGQAVFEATTGNGTSVGTAFLVGENLVFTNRHVMGLKPFAKDLPCGQFSIKLNQREEWVRCEKVEYCSSRYDYCVVQMQKMKNEKHIGSEVKPVRLTEKVRTNPDASLLHIGNARGFGLQASRGRGIILKDGEFFHYAPTLGGSSGAPLFNERGEVIGLNWGLTGGDYTNDSSFNRGVLAQTIFNELKKKDVPLLKKIKSFRSWHRRQLRHRLVEVFSKSPTKTDKTAPPSVLNPVRK